MRVEGVAVHGLRDSDRLFACGRQFADHTGRRERLSRRRGKCGLKALQYMALGIPTVCSPVGVNSQIIQDGENGCLAAAEDEWVETLAPLLKSPASRKRL